MKKILLATVLALLSALAFAQERIAIAVFPFEVYDNAITVNEAYQLYSVFTNQFTNMSAGRLHVVPRHEVDKLINKEAAFQLTDFSAQKKTAEMMKVENANQVLSGLIGKVGNSINITVSLYTYPNLIQLPGGADQRVANVNELFDKVPELVQNMQNAIGSVGASAGSASSGSRTGIFFAGDTLSARGQQTIISGLREAVQTQMIKLVIDEKTNASNGYGFTVTVYCEQVITNGNSIFKADATVAFSRGGQILCQSAPYYITESSETLAVRRITERLKGDMVFFNKVNDALK